MDLGDFVRKWAASSSAERANKHAFLLDRCRVLAVPETKAPKAEKALWPKSLPERIAAVRDLLQQTTTAWTVSEAAAHFKRANQKDVEVVLMSLAALALAVAFNADGKDRWRSAARMAA